MEFIRIFIFLFFVAMTSKAWGHDSTPLVYIYCDYLTSQTPTAEDGDRGWAELVRHFERRELITKKSTISENPKFQECVRKNSSLFETGEFIFEGKSQVNESLGVLNETKSQGPTLMASDFVFEDKSLTSDYFSIALESKQPWAPAGMENEMKRREARYSDLWKNFLEAVRLEVSKRNPSESLN